MTITTGSFGTTPSSDKGILADWQHASKIFLSAGYRLSPRVKFLYYLFVEIDSAAHGASSFTAATKNGAEISLLVKRAELPKFSFDTVTKNQYNRKRVVYKQLSYEPITLTFHDDNAGVMNSLYGLYYSYYSKDHSNTLNDYKLGNSFSGARYNMDVDIRVNLFKRISLFTLGNGLYNEYKLLAPRIRSWNHGDVDYSSNNDVVESSMTIEYESVIFSSGPVATSKMDGFATLGYDTKPSPNDPLREIGVGSGNLNTALGSYSQKNLLQKIGSYAASVAKTNRSYIESSSPYSGGIVMGDVFAEDITEAVPYSPDDRSYDFDGFDRAIQDIESPSFEDFNPENVEFGDSEYDYDSWEPATWDDVESDLENSYTDVFDEGVDADDESGFADFDF